MDCIENWCNRWLLNIHVIALISQMIRLGPKVATLRTKTLNFSRVIHLNGEQKFDLMGPRPRCCQYQYWSVVLVNCCIRGNAKRNWKNIRFWCYYFIIFIICGISTERGWFFCPPPPWLRLWRGRFKQAWSWKISFVISRDLLSLKRFSLEHFFSFFWKKFFRLSYLKMVVKSNFKQNN